MKEIIELNRRILAEVGGAIPEDGLTLSRESDWETVQMPQELRSEIERVREQTNQIVPDDFEYNIYLGNKDSVFGGLTYRDGLELSGMIPLLFAPENSFFEQLQKMDWDGIRQKVLSKTARANEFRQRLAKVRPRLPATVMFQKWFRRQVRDFTGMNLWNDEKVHIMMYEKGVGLIAVQYDTLEEFQKILPAYMQKGFHPVTVIEKFQSLEAWRIDAMKWDAYNSKKGSPFTQAQICGKVEAWAAGTLNLGMA